MPFEHVFTLAAALLVATVFAAESNASPGDFVATSVQRTGSFTLPVPADRAFPFFEPLPEKQWAEGWNPAVVYPSSGETVEGMVFTVRHPDEPETVWTVANFDRPNRQVTYILFTPGLRMGRIDVRCSGLAEGTKVEVRYTFTALSDAGKNYVDAFSAEKYAARMKNWQHAIEYFLHTGKRWPHHE